MTMGKFLMNGYSILKEQPIKAKKKQLWDEGRFCLYPIAAGNYRNPPLL